MPGPDGIADAARFFFARTSVANGLGECMIAGARVYGHISVELQDYTLEGKLYKPAASVYEVNAEGYENKGLSLAMKTLPGFRFDALDHVFPESILFAMHNAQSGEAIKLYHEFVTPRSDLHAIWKRYEGGAGQTEILSYQGCKALKGISEQAAILAVANGNDVYVLAASGRSADQTLQKAMANFVFKKY